MALRSIVFRTAPPIPTRPNVCLTLLAYLLGGKHETAILFGSDGHVRGMGY